ncbi:MAG: hypothetical protein Q8P46_02685 [Hyphomicrobiales bacterium]|nr:hypothetical protein [Hyphomicrobiales bacterium]
MGRKGIAALIAGGSAIGLAATFAAPAALADNAAPGGAAKTCTCRHKGQNFELGALVCLRSPQGPQLARCGVFLNNTSWQFTGQSCVVSMPQSRPMIRLATHNPQQ